MKHDETRGRVPRPARASAPGSVLTGGLLMLLVGCTGADQTQLAAGAATPRGSAQLRQALYAGPLWTQFGAAEDRLHTLASASDEAGRTYVFGLAADGSIWQAFEAPGSASSWQPLGTAEDRLATLVAQRTAIGRIELFGTARDHSVWRTAPNEVGEGWSGWQSFGDPDRRLRSVAPVRDGSGRTLLLGLGEDDSIWSNVQQSDGSWSGWLLFGSSEDRLVTLAAQLSADGRVEVFGTAADQTIWLNSQAAVGGSWSGWQVFGSAEDRLRLVTPAIDANGATQVIGLAADDSIWIDSHSGGGWSGWQPLGSSDDRLHTLALGKNSDGRLEIVGVAADGRLWRTSQRTPAGSWSPWLAFGAADDRLQTLLLERGADGRLRAFGTAADDSIWINTQAAPGQWLEVPLPLHSVFAGTATLTTSYGSAPGPFLTPISIGVSFDATRTSFTVDPFELSAATFATPFGANTTTIRHSSSAPGSFDEVTGALDVTLDLRFDQSISLPAVDSTLRVPLSTSSAAGSSRDPSTGAASFGGTGTFRGGVLNAQTGTLLLSGAFDPSP